MNRVMAIPLIKFAPYDLQWFHVMCHILPRSIRAYDLKHTRFVQYKAYLITRVSEPRTLSVIKKVRITMGEKRNHLRQLDKRGLQLTCLILLV